MHIIMWRSWKNHVILQKSFICYTSTNFIMSPYYSLWDDVVIWWNIAPWFDILAHPHITMWPSCTSLVILQNSFLCHILTNFLTSQYIAPRPPVTFCHICACTYITLSQAFHNTRMWQSLPNVGMSCSKL